jgi:diguanylate cyclase (GGDEF)-like protein
MSDVAEVLRVDPVLSAKLLRMANSPLYLRRQPCETFQQALVLLGLNATLTLALTFSLAGMAQGGRAGGLDYSQVWRRSLLAATAARVLGANLGLRESEELFLAALMQDLGMLALDAGFPDLYEGLQAGEQSHEQLVALERSTLGVDHAEVGGWLLERWNLPPRFCEAVGASHAACAHGDDADVVQRFNQAVALSGPVADLWLSKEQSQSLMHGIQDSMRELLGLDDATLVGVMQTISEEAPEIESLFEVDLLDQRRSEWVLQEAREMLAFRNLQMVQESAVLRQEASTLKAQADALEEKSRRDNLTGLANRGHLDATLDDWFDASCKASTSLCVVFVDLDNFKHVNDSYGHSIGDDVLKRTADVLMDMVRSSDLVGRYGGEEFVILLRDCGADGGRRLSERILKRVRELRHPVEGAVPIAVTASMGLATHAESVLFGSSSDLLRAADEALYRAKQSGKDRVVVHALHADAA